MNTVTSATTATRAMAVTHHPVWRVGSGVAVTARKLLVSKVSVAACVVGVATATESSLEAGRGSPA